MGKRKITILEHAVTSIAEVSFFIVSKGMSVTAKRFVDDVFSFIETLSDERILHRLCKNNDWKMLRYRCVTFRKKYTIAYLEQSEEIVICDFKITKLIK